MVLLYVRVCQYHSYNLAGTGSKCCQVCSGSPLPSAPTGNLPLIQICAAALAFEFIYVFIYCAGLQREAHTSVLEFFICCASRRRHYHCFHSSNSDHTLFYSLTQFCRDYHRGPSLDASIDFVPLMFRLTLERKS